ncbi:TRAP transporter fused permease subunit [Litorivicinus lipolyticus]|uniref:TRAP transporter fused permease subunit n=1 Tax=Litorivicinus lipolyticus TaxID=418701 RepID=A0A5Q2QDG6_9GAMM|nr:TRAP transporter fused permease subunit [Litorivicinus lipolyticus]QGG80066.1 TRAP transporter fused permease subunit [Litorivicinus lipolyticus]
MFDRNIPGGLSHVAWLLGLVIAIFHLWVAFVPVVSEFARNAIHFGGFVVLAALTRPANLGHAYERKGWILDLIFAGAVAWAASHVILGEDAIYDRGVRLIAVDWTAIGVLILAAIEFSRRVAGWVVPCLIIVCLTYLSFWGKYVPGVFSFGGLSLETLAFRSVYGDDALFGTISRISSTYVFVFIIFGAFLVRSGAGEFVIDLARAVAGRLQGGPGIVAVLASGLTGTISGSAVANTASTGVITIPMMKRAGFPARFAGAVEASASTGGQLMPPIMGAGAFVMAAYTQIPYETIALAAAVPALLYFASVIYFVRIQARKLDLKPMENEEQLTLGQAFKRGGASFVIPICLLIGLLVSGFTPTYAAVIGIVAIIASSHLTQRPMGVFDVLDALVLGSKNMVMTAILLCSVGLIVNVIATAGIGNTFSLMIADWAGGNVVIAIGLIAIASLVLGMGLPVTAAYIVLATLSAPALASMIADQAVVPALLMGVNESILPVVQMGLPGFSADSSAAEVAAMWAQAGPDIKPMIRDMLVAPEAATAALLASHMIIFWLSQDSNVTPPVCLAAFTAAAIAKSHPMKTGFTSWKLSKGLYIVPLLFAYSPILSGDWAAVFWVGSTALVGIYLVAGALEGWLEYALPVWGRALALVAGVALMWPGVLAPMAGAAGAIVLIIQQMRASSTVQGKTDHL